MGEKKPRVTMNNLNHFDGVDIEDMEDGVHASVAKVSPDCRLESSKRIGGVADFELLVDRLCNSDHRLGVIRAARSRTIAREERRFEVPRRVPRGRRDTSGPRDRESIGYLDQTSDLRSRWSRHFP
jgi:hypothetical protein